MELNEPIELVFHELVVEAAVEAILSNFSVDETQAALQERWPRLDAGTIEEAMVEALVERVLTPGPLAPPGAGVDPADLHPSWQDPVLSYDPDGVEFIQPKRPEKEPPWLPIAHIAPVGEDGTRAALCGAELLGIHAFGEYELCETCVKLNGGDPRERSWQGPS
jgi:hypothetical protein